MAVDVDDIYANIKRARKIIGKYLHKTPLDHSRTFSRMTGAEGVFLKLENLQKTGSFKPRGALYKISQLSEDDKSKGVVAVSAGNHAQGVAFAASIYGISAKIVMPIFAPISKILATRSYGAEVVLYGETFDDAVTKVNEIIKEEGRVLVHPYDDPFVIAGQGTIGLEIIEDMKKPDVVVVPVGGGGLISGIAIALKKKFGNDVTIVGVQTEAYPGVLVALGKAQFPKKPKFTLADGIAVKKPGKITTQIIKEYVDDLVTVSDKEIARTIFLLLERAKTIAEGAGAVGLAAVLSGKIDVRGKKVVTIISGGNIDMTRLVRILNRELILQRRLVKLTVNVPDVPGSLFRLLSVLARVRVNVIDISIEKYDPYVDPQEVIVDIVAEIPLEETLSQLLKEIDALGFSVEVNEF